MSIYREKAELQMDDLQNLKETVIENKTVKLNKIALNNKKNREKSIQYLNSISERIHKNIIKASRNDGVVTFYIPKTYFLGTETFNDLNSMYDGIVNFDREFDTIIPFYTIVVGFIKV